MKVNESNFIVCTSFFRDAAVPSVLLVALVFGLSAFSAGSTRESSSYMFDKCFHAGTELISEKAIAIMLRNGVVL